MALSPPVSGMKYCVKLTTLFRACAASVIETNLLLVFYIDPESSVTQWTMERVTLGISSKDLQYPIALQAHSSENYGLNFVLGRVMVEIRLVAGNQECDTPYKTYCQ
uniref:Uncharacterized protein n=1 Tax=Pararge aegeria TaxID=116150 RepID=S4PXE5_9NEOP